MSCLFARASTHQTVFALLRLPASEPELQVTLVAVCCVLVMPVLFKFIGLPSGLRGIGLLVQPNPSVLVCSQRAADDDVGRRRFRFSDGSQCGAV
jgi:hypothetical protein